MSVDVTRIRSGLFMGSAPNPSKQQYRQFDKIVLCAREYQPASEMFGRTGVLRVPLDDDFASYPSVEEQRLACRVASFVAHWVQQGQRVLVTCMAGRNRSGLIVATALLKLHPQITPGIAVDHIRSLRGPLALSNPKFVDLLAKNYCAAL